MVLVPAMLAVHWKVTLFTVLPVGTITAAPGMSALEASSQRCTGWSIV